jgi:hypothetical protein
MFFNAKLNSSRPKHVVYLIAATILGILLSLFAHAAIEALYLSLAQPLGYNIIWYGGCALPPVLQISLLLVGGLTGFFMGRFWWRKVYIERVWAKKYRPRKNS